MALPRRNPNVVFGLASPDNQCVNVTKLGNVRRTKVLDSGFVTRCGHREQLERNEDSNESL